MTMRQRLIQLLTAFAALTAGVVIGMAWQHSRTGWHSTQIDEKDWSTAFGQLKLEHVYETVGAHFLQPAKSRVTLHPADGERITLFEGQPVFQEKFPVVRNVEIDGQVVRFEDGARAYSLKIDKLPRPAE